ncbi:SS18-like protein 2 isoform X1 [Ictalurus furcatus]|uniref:SS18-like protein 2 isoform X1 n=1 Tax=Ictalurus furcatus TaxID=66913 RepID=UPI00235026C7|nr:SS18-like protein 2 isoform X1 [Ictalurus furcatus]
MSVVFVPKRQRGKAQINQETIQRLLNENDQLVRCIAEYMQKGRATECVQYQQILHRNIVYLGTLADASPDVSVSPSQPAQLSHTYTLCCIIFNCNDPACLSGSL